MYIQTPQTYRARHIDIRSVFYHPCFGSPSSILRFLFILFILFINSYTNENHTHTPPQCNILNRKFISTALRLMIVLYNLWIYMFVVFASDWVYVHFGVQHNHHRWFAYNFEIRIFGSATWGDCVAKYISFTCVDIHWSTLRVRGSPTPERASSR